MKRRPPGAGGNAGAVAAGFLFKSSIPWNTAFLILGVLVTTVSFLAFVVRFSPQAAKEAKTEMEEVLAARRGEIAGGVPVSLS